jgi:MHS family proline/betaine transporter-like MFS transporter
MKKFKLILIAAIANSLEWYDYTLFGNFADIIGVKFFAASSTHSPLLKALLVFAVGYVMRPVGGVFFGLIGDKLGRKVALSMSIFFMGAPTIMIGLLPTYETWGNASTICIVLLRMMQGLSMGGVLTSSICFSVEHADKKNQNFFASIPMASICSGILLGSFVAYFFRSIMQPEDFDSWGWRIPFLLGAAVLLVGGYINKHLLESPDFDAQASKDSNFTQPLIISIKTYWKRMLISIAINATGSIIFYLQAVYISNSLKAGGNFAAASIDKMSTISYAIMMVASVVAGLVADIFSNIKILCITIILLIIAIIPILNNMLDLDFNSIFYAHVLLGVLAAFYISTEAAMQANFYPPHVRSTALAFSYNIATTIFGGATPYIMQLIIQETGSIIYCAYYVLFFAFVSLCAIYLYIRELKSQGLSNLSI